MMAKHSDICWRGHDMSEGSENVYFPPDGHRQCRACKRERGRIYYNHNKPFLKSQLQFVKLVYDKHGEGEQLDNALDTIKEEGANPDVIRKLIIPRKLVHHHLILFEGDYNFLMLNVENASAFIRNLVREAVSKMEGVNDIAAE